MVAAALLVAGCSRPTPATPGVSNDTVKIGSIAALSGPVAAVGVPVKQGFEACIKWANDEGGVHGRKIQVLFEDDQFNPALATAAVKKLVEQDQVFCICPFLGTVGVLATLDYFEQNKVPLVYPMTGVSQPAHPLKKWVFAVQPNYFDEARIMLRYAVEKLGVKKVAVLWQNTDIGKQGLDGIKEGLKDFSGVELVYNGAHEATDVDFTSTILGAKQASPDAVFIYTVVAQAAGILSQAQKHGLQATFFTTYVNADLNLIKLAGQAAEGVILGGWVPIPTPDDANWKKFVDIYQKYNQTDQLPSGFATAGFIAGEILVEALKRAGRDPTREKLVEALETFDNFRGIQTPPITYTKDSHSGVKTLYLLKVEKGAFVPLGVEVTLK